MMQGVKKERISDESPPSMKLCLGIGSDHDHDLDDSRHVFSRLTEAQLHELRQQSLIFKYIVAGLPVPLPLVIPIWNSVASSFGSSIGGADLYTQFPRFAGLSSQGFDYRHMMDPEPGRCRRTDGKKWRCGKDVVPGKKYCERHMHRGQQQRSRKPVEASQTAAASDKKPPNNLSKNSENPNSSNLDQASTQCKIPCSSYPFMSSSPSTICGNLDLKITSINMAATANADYKNTLANVNTSTITGYENTPVPMTASDIQADTTTSRATIVNNKSSSSINLKRHYIDDGNCNFSNSVSYEGIIHRSSKGRKMKNFGSNISQGLNFSPKSVLQVQGCGTLPLYKNDVELEPGRCKRTDGKKWRCRRDVVTNKKYCEMHMHRGRKKQADPAAIHDVSSSACLRSTAIFPSSANCRDLNTDLSISIPSSPPLIMTNDDTSTTSNSTDTTISDTIIGAYQN